MYHANLDQNLQDVASYFTADHVATDYSHTLKWESYKVNRSNHIATHCWQTTILESQTIETGQFILFSTVDKSNAKLDSLISDTG